MVTDNSNFILDWTIPEEGIKNWNDVTNQIKLTPGLCLLLLFCCVILFYKHYIHSLLVFLRNSSTTIFFSRISNIIFVVFLRQRFLLRIIIDRKRFLIKILTAVKSVEWRYFCIRDAAANTESCPSVPIFIYRYEGRRPRDCVGLKLEERNFDKCKIQIGWINISVYV